MLSIESVKFVAAMCKTVQLPVTAPDLEQHAAKWARLLRECQATIEAHDKANAQTPPPGMTIIHPGGS